MSQVSNLKTSGYTVCCKLIVWHGFRLLNQHIWSRKPSAIMVWWFKLMCLPKTPDVESSCPPTNSFKCDRWQLSSPCHSTAVNIRPLGPQCWVSNLEVDVANYADPGWSNLFSNQSSSGNLQTSFEPAGGTVSSCCHFPSIQLVLDQQHGLSLFFNVIVMISAAVPKPGLHSLQRKKQI